MLSFTHFYARFFRRFAKAQQGATIVEFVVVAPILFLLVFGILEFGLMQFTAIALESAMMQAAREVSLGKITATADTATLIKAYIHNKTQWLVNPSLVVISANTVANGGATKPEYCNTNPPRLGDLASYSSGCPNDAAGVPYACIEDFDGHPSTCNGTAIVNTGNAGDVLEVRVSYSWKIQVPLMETVLGRSAIMLTSSTLVKNEPF